MNSKINLNTIILVLILIVLVFVIVGGFALVSMVRQLTQPLERVERALEEKVEEIINPTPTILPDPVTIIHQVRNLSRLETASYTIEKVITAESGQSAFAFLFGDRLILVAHGQVIAGVDLAKMGEDDVITAEGERVVVTCAGDGGSPGGRAGDSERRFGRWYLGEGAAERRGLCAEPHSVIGFPRGDICPSSGDSHANCGTVILYSNGRFTLSCAPTVGRSAGRLARCRASPDRGSGLPRLPR